MTEQDRVDRTRWVGIITLALVACLLLLTAAGLFALSVLGAQQQDLRTTARRGECRSQIQNADEDEFRHRIGEALEASTKRDQARVAAILEQIQTEELTQHKIERVCPAPLVVTPPVGTGPGPKGAP